MNKISNKSGFTLVEVLVSVGVMLVFLPFAASMLTNSQLLASFSKHKSQAAFVAQQLIETQRQNAFVTLAAGQSKTIIENVVLDTKGNYNNNNINVCNNSINKNIYCGTTVITITPAVYTSTLGVQTTNPIVDHFVVKVYWTEEILNLPVPMTEVYAADIANDTMLN